MNKKQKTILVFSISFIFWLILAIITNGFGGLPDPPAPITMLVLFLFPSIITFIFYTIIATPKKPKTLSEKYDALNILRRFALILMIIYSISLLYAFLYFIDSQDVTRNFLLNAIINSLETYIIAMFALFCIIKIIDFLFDLDNNKKNIDKNIK